MEDKKKPAAKTAKKPDGPGANMPQTLYAGLAQFQSQCPAITKDSKTEVLTKKGGKYSYKYGSLPHVLEQIKPHMAAAGLGFTQPIEMLANGGEAIRTILFHVVDEETIESQIELPDFKFDQMNVMQSKGSIITYLRRYAIMSILGIVAEEDDNDAQGDGKKTTKPKPVAKSQTPAPAKPQEPKKPWLNPEVDGKPNPKWNKALKYLADGGKIGDIKAKYQIGKNNEERLLNDAITFDDLPFDRKDAEDAEILSTEGDGPNNPLDEALNNGEVTPGEPNKLFDDQGPTPE